MAQLPETGRFILILFRGFMAIGFHFIHSLARHRPVPCVVRFCYGFLRKAIS